jgi:hypothetical protein
MRSRKFPFRLEATLFVLTLLVFGALAIYQRTGSRAPEASQKPEPSAALSLAGHASGSSRSVLSTGKGEKEGSPEDPRRREFRELARETLRSLGRREDVRRLKSEEAHFFPEVLRRSALALGQIAEQVEAHPGLIPDAVAFYSDCAKSEELVHSIRALCLARFQHHAPDFPAEFSRELPEMVVRLSQSVSFR